jgi:hypothetical protein
LVLPAISSFLFAAYARTARRGVLRVGVILLWVGVVLGLVGGVLGVLNVPLPVFVR